MEAPDFASASAGTALISGLVVDTGETTIPFSPIFIAPWGTIALFLASLTSFGTIANSRLDFKFFTFSHCYGNFAGQIALELDFSAGGVH